MEQLLGGQLRQLLLQLVRVDARFGRIARQGMRRGQSGKAARVARVHGGRPAVVVDRLGIVVELKLNHNIAFGATSWQIEGAGDFDHDGDSDILWRHTEGAVVTWEMEGGVFVQSHSLGAVATSWQIM